MNVAATPPWVKWLALVLVGLIAGLIVRDRLQRPPEAVPDPLQVGPTIFPVWLPGEQRSRAGAPKTDPAAGVRTKGSVELQDRNARAHLHLSVRAVLTSPARDTSECREVWKLLRRNGISIGTLPKVYEALFEMDAMMRVEQGPKGNLLVNNEEFDGNDPKHVEAIKSYKELRMFQLGQDVVQDLQGMPPEEIALLLQIKPKVRFRGTTLPGPADDRSLTLEDLPPEYREP